MLLLLVELHLLEHFHADVLAWRGRGRALLLLLLHGRGCRVMGSGRRSLFMNDLTMAHPVGVNRACCSGCNRLAFAVDATVAARRDAFVHYYIVAAICRVVRWHLMRDRGPQGLS